MEEIKVGDTVRILEFPKGHINAEGRVEGISEKGRIWVSNLNQPFAGTISQFFDREEIEKCNS